MAPLVWTIVLTAGVIGLLLFRRVTSRQIRVMREHPKAVQKALDDMQIELANTQIAIQQKKTAEEQKLAMETLASAKMTPEAFLQYCLVVTERLAQQGKKISEAWTCTGSMIPITVAAK